MKKGETFAHLDEVMQFQTEPYFQELAYFYNNNVLNGWQEKKSSKSRTKNRLLGEER